jgi:hypothetical protein
MSTMILLNSLHLYAELPTEISDYPEYYAY